ncbi:MAG: DNA-directed RNA polymerase subunit H [Candidatus Diapherotrites archaeon]|nr:DNA-directed RNA polymerase subunit H [Candidatus Diapherotrites archaeon]
MKKKEFEELVQKHQWVPSHESISEEEKAELLSKLTCNLENLPKIDSNDPVIKAQKLKEGTVIKITRANGSIYYRVVA